MILSVSWENQWRFRHLVESINLFLVLLDLGHIIHLLIGGLINIWVFIVVRVIFLLIVEIKCICILKVLILFSGLSFASITFFSEWEVEIVAVETDPISFTSLVVRFARFWCVLAFLNWGWVWGLHDGIWMCKVWNNFQNFNNN